MRRRRPSDETLVTLRGRLEGLPARSPERQRLMLGCADLHGVSIATIYRALGINHQKNYHLGARPIPLTDPGTEPVREVLA